MKLRATHGLISNAHLPTNYTPAEYSRCTLVLPVPPAHAAHLTVRKLKLPKKRHECVADNVLLLGTVERSQLSSDWLPFDRLKKNETDRWHIERSYCGKVQDYTKTERSWTSAGPLIFLRLSRTHSNFFSLRFHVASPCSGARLTDNRGEIRVTDAELAAVGQCNFQVHLAYGYKVYLSVHLWVDHREPSPDLASPHQDGSDASNSIHAAIQVDNRDRASLLLLETGRCQLLVKMEDVTGPQSRCLSLAGQQLSASFLSQTNVAQFRSLWLRNAFAGKSSQVL